MKRKDYAKEAMKKIAEIGKKEEVELKSETVELGLIDDFRSDIEKAKDLIDFVTDMNDLLDRAKMVAKNGSGAADAYLDRIKERGDKVTKQLKDLGLDSSSVKEFKEAEKTKTFLGKIKKDFDRVLKINS